MFKVILGSFGTLVSKWPVSRKRLVLRMKRSEIWDSWILVTYIWGTYDLVVFNVILGSFGALVSKCPVTPKRLVVERNGVKFGNHEH